MRKQAQAKLQQSIDVTLRYEAEARENVLLWYIDAKIHPQKGADPVTNKLEEALARAANTKERAEETRRRRPHPGAARCES